MSVENRENFVIYPSYFNSNLTRSNGRKQPLSESVKKPTSEELSKILSSMKLVFKSESKARPNNSIEGEKRFLVKCDFKKSALLHQIGNKFKELRRT